MYLTNAISWKANKNETVYLSLYHTLKYLHSLKILECQETFLKDFKTL